MGARRMREMTPMSDHDTPRPRPARKSRSAEREAAEGLGTPGRPEPDLYYERLHLSQQKAEAFTEALEEMIDASRIEFGHDRRRAIERARAKIVEILTGDPDV
jgi:hypothetical protein